MIACVSPAPSNASTTAGTLRYASNARKITNRPVVHEEEVEEEPGPYSQDVPDPDPMFDRRTMWIDTPEFGPVFARSIGDPSDELILLVHGSGPGNSSLVRAAQSVGVRTYPTTVPWLCVDAVVSRARLRGGSESRGRNGSQAPLFLVRSH